MYLGSIFGSAKIFVRFCSKIVLSFYDGKISKIFPYPVPAKYPLPKIKSYGGLLKWGGKPLASLSATCVIVLSGGCLWSFKFSIDVFVPWITNIMAATLLLCVHCCSVGNPTSIASEQCQPNLLILKGVDIDYHLSRKIFIVSPPIGDILCLQRLCVRDIFLIYI